MERVFSRNPGGRRAKRPGPVMLGGRPGPGHRPAVRTDNTQATHEQRVIDRPAKGDRQWCFRIVWRGDLPRLRVEGVIQRRCHRDGLGHVLPEWRAGESRPGAADDERVFLPLLEHGPEVDPWLDL